MKVTLQTQDTMPILSVVYVTQSRVAVATLAVYTGQSTDYPTMPWQVFADWVRAVPDPFTAAGNSDLTRNNSLVVDVPGFEGQNFLVKGKLVADLTPGNFGYRELGDFLILDFLCEPDGTATLIDNRLSSSQLTRAANPARVRAHDRNGFRLMSVVSPFAPTDFTQVALIEAVYNGYRPILLDGTWDADKTGSGPSTRFIDGMWSATAANNLQVAAGASLTFPVQLVWNANTDFSWTGGTPCQNAVELDLSTNAGYLPKQKITTDANGAGAITITALGLTAGDVITVKAGSGFYTKVGAFNIAVV